MNDFHRRAWAHSDAIIEELPLDSRVTVAWWPEGLTDKLESIAPSAGGPARALTGGGVEPRAPRTR